MCTHILLRLACMPLVASVAFAQPPSQSDPASRVNPFIGTTNGGNVFPGATMPFDMLQFSPQPTPINTKGVIAAPDGCEYRAKHIRGFSLTNVEGWGCTGAVGAVRQFSGQDMNL